MSVINKQLYDALMAVKVPEEMATKAAASVAEYEKAMNELKQTLMTKIDVLDMKLNILILIALVPAAKAVGLW